MRLDDARAQSVNNRWFPAPLAAGSLDGGDRTETPEPEDCLTPQIAGLLRLQRKLIDHCFRLQRHEQLLLARVQQRKRGAGRKTIQQLELERQRLGRELHTGVGQMLAAIRLQLEIASSQMPDPPPAAKQALDRVSRLAVQALEQVRAVSKRLHPPEWQRLALNDALQQLWDTSGIPERFQAAFRVAPLPAEPELEVKVLIYRALQEALSNLTRHSRATTVDASLEIARGRLVLTVRDNGVGFDPARLFSAPASLTAGIGLRAIREQAFDLGGELAVHSGSQGTTLVVSAPE